MWSERSALTAGLRSPCSLDRRALARRAVRSVYRVENASENAPRPRLWRAWAARGRVAPGPWAAMHPRGARCAGHRRGGRRLGGGFRTFRPSRRGRAAADAAPGDREQQYAVRADVRVPRWPMRSENAVKCAMEMRPPRNETAATRPRQRPRPYPGPTQDATLSDSSLSSPLDTVRARHSLRLTSPPPRTGPQARSGGARARRSPDRTPKYGRRGRWEAPRRAAGRRTGPSCVRSLDPQF